MAEEIITITGEITEISHRKDDGWGSFFIKDYPYKATGVLANICDVGTEVTCTGVLHVNKFGRQLKCSQIVPSPPDFESRIGVTRLLRRLPGIGEKKAELAIETYGIDGAWDLAKNNPELIGVRPEMVTMAKSIALMLDSGYDTIIYLLSIGLTDNQAARITEVYQEDTVDVVSKNPYRIIDDVDGFAFRMTDKVAMKAGISPGNIARVKACIRHCLEDSAATEGHIWREGWELVKLVLETLTDSAMKIGVPLRDLPDKQMVKACVYQMEDEGIVLINDGKVFSRLYYDAERSILDFLNDGGF